MHARTAMQCGKHCSPHVSSYASCFGVLRCADMYAAICIPIPCWNVQVSVYIKTYVSSCKHTGVREGVWRETDDDYHGVAVYFLLACLGSL